MPVEIQVPVLGESVVEATVAKWLKQEGEPVQVGDPLVELETDKVNTELSADDHGVLERILRQEGETVHPGDVLAILGQADPAKPAPPDPEPAHQPAPAAEPAASNGDVDAEKVRASPLAERVADDLEIDLTRVHPSGPGGRVTREDVQAFAAQALPAAAPAPAPPAARDVAPPAAISEQASERPEKRERLSRRRLTIARRLVEAQRTAAMLTTFNEADMSAVMGLRQRRRDQFKERHGVSLGYMSFFTRAAIGALKAFPQVNSELQGEELVLKEYYDIGIAIGDPEGLVVPVVRDADRLTFAEIEKAIAAFAGKAKERALTVEDLRGGTFTITNGGVFGSLLSTPILNPPQVAILGMHKIEERPVAVKGEVVVRPMMYLALSYDHRVVDGREAVQFLVRVKDLIEDPEALLLEL